MNCKHKLKKFSVIFLTTTIIVVGVLILCSSVIAKRLVEKYDEKYIGRKITIDWIYVNPLTGYLHIKGLKIYEQASDSVFISMKGVSANFSLFKLFSNTLEVSSITLDQPVIKIIQRKNDFNFNDLVIKYSPKGPPDTTSEPLRIRFLNVKIKGGHFYYIDEVIPVNFSIKSVNIESSDGWRSDEDIIKAKVSFLSETGAGGMQADFGMNLKNLYYMLNVKVVNFDLEIIEQYMKEFANYGTFSAYLDANLKTNGSFREAENINIVGNLAINNFRFGKDTTNDYVSFEKVSLSMKDVNPKMHRYYIDTALLIRPYFKFELYDHGLDNVQAMFGTLGGNVSAAQSDVAQFNLIFTIGEYITKLAKNFFRSYYKVNYAAIYKGDIIFNDYSLTEKFAVELNPLTICADSIDKNLTRVDVSLKSGIRPYGNLAVNLSISPRDTADFDLQYHFQGIPISMFNPYTLSYTSYPLDRGTIEFHGSWNVRNGSIQSVNHVVLVDPRTTKRVKNKDNEWIPTPLIMTLVRERGNYIDYEIPITGNLNNPKFHLRDVIFDFLENIFIKPSSIPYGLVVKTVENKIEKSLTLKWKMRQYSLLPTQERFVKKMADFLVKNPEASITIYPHTYALKEKEYILFFEAKKYYYLKTHNKNAPSFDEEDIEKVEKMSVKDSLFVHYLDKQITDSMVFTSQEKCLWLINSATVNARFEQLKKERENAFMFYFKEKGVEKRVRIAASENVIPYNGFSFYKIDYHGELQELLMRAHKAMNDLNDEMPRKFLKKERVENKSEM